MVEWMLEKRDLLLDFRSHHWVASNLFPPTACATLNPCTNQHTLGCLGPFSLSYFCFLGFHQFFIFHLHIFSSTNNLCYSSCNKWFCLQFLFSDVNFGIYFLTDLIFRSMVFRTMIAKIHFDNWDQFVCFIDSNG